MDQYTNTFLSLSQFKITEDPTFSYKIREGFKFKVTTIYGRITSILPRVCPHCGKVFGLTSNQHLKIKLKHLTIGDQQIVIEVEYHQMLCTHCHTTTCQKIPFKHSRHCITNCFFNQILGFIRSSQITIKTIADTLLTNRKLIKEIDKRRLIEKYGDMMPTHLSHHISIDEFSLHRGHKYATVVMDWQTGEILFLEKGKTIYQLIHFFDKVGRAWMSHVKSISMDMNAQYNSAIKSQYPHIAIVYDGFHIVKNFNDRILTELRRLEQNRLCELETRCLSQIRDLRKNLRASSVKEKKEFEDMIYENKLTINGIKRKYGELKHTRFLITSSKKALEEKDRLARKHNRELYETYEKFGLAIPENEHKWSIRNLDRLDEILSCNENLGIAYFLGDQLKAGLDSTNEDEMKRGLNQWLKISESFEKKIPMLKNFNKMIESRMDGILSRVKYPVSNGPLEGLNNSIKVTKRMAYGYRDEEYFFYKLYDKSRLYIKHRTLEEAMRKRKLKNIVI